MQQRDDSGILFRNDRKEKETHPDYKGHAMIDGVEYWMSSWIKKGQKGTFMTFSFQPKQDKPAQPAQSQANDFDEDCPF